MEDGEPSVVSHEARRSEQMSFTQSARCSVWNVAGARSVPEEHILKVTQTPESQLHLLFHSFTPCEGLAYRKSGVLHQVDSLWTLQNIWSQ